MPYPTIAGQWYTQAKCTYLNGLTLDVRKAVINNTVKIVPTDNRDMPASPPLIKR